MILRVLDFYRLSDLGCPDFVGTVNVSSHVPVKVLLKLSSEVQNMQCRANRV